jgi:Rrf2 family protein
MLSATANHALRAVLFLARQPGGSLATADEIATAIGAPRNYLSKTLYLLSKAGITAGVPGRHGGFALAVEPDRLTLHSIISVFDEAPSSPRCLLGDRACNSQRPCAAHRRWTAINHAHDSTLAATTIAELLER